MGNIGSAKEEVSSVIDTDWVRESFINLTPHAIVLLRKKAAGGYEEVGKIEPHSPGKTVRLVRRDTEEIKELRNGISVISPPEYTGFEPDPTNWLAPPTTNFEKGLIVSSLLGEYWKEHKFEWMGGYFSPDSGPDSCVRYPRGHELEGQIMGVQRLVCWQEPEFKV